MNRNQPTPARLQGVSRSLIALGTGEWRGVGSEAGIGVRISPAGIVVSRMEVGQTAELGLSLAASSTAGDVCLVRALAPVVREDRAVFARGSFTERYANTALGLELGLVIETGSAERLTFDFALTGTVIPKPSADGRSIAFLDAAGRPALRYGALNALDADAREVPAVWTTLAGADGIVRALRLDVDAQAARFPVEISGVITAAALERRDLGPASTAAAPASAAVTAGPPPNDTCEGAEPIPPAGPFPYLTATTADITGATTLGDPPSPACQHNVSRGIWYRFTPAAAGYYDLSLCADAPTATTVDDTVLAVYTSSDGTCGGTFTQLPGACDDDGCATKNLQSVIRRVSLNAGTAYFVLAAQFGTTAPVAGSTAMQLLVDRHTSPPNDNCAAPTPLALDTPLPGTTVDAQDDIRLVGAGCFAGVGQTASTAPGKDVVYSFVAPSAGAYAFRVTGAGTAVNVVLYVASDCPAGSGPSTLGACIAAANRNTGNGAEEVGCVNLAAGQTIYAYVDEDAAASAGSAFTVEVNRCAQEVEPNAAPAQASALACGIEAKIYPAGEADFFRIGAPAASSRVFAVVDGVAANSTDFDLRVTSATGTLEYDDSNNDPPLGSLSPNVAGTPLAGAEVYLAVTHFTASALAEPYRLYATVEPPAASATPEVEPNDTVVAATAGANDYFKGALTGAADVDVFRFNASAGELLMLSLDLDPQRDNTPLDGTLALLDANGATVLAVNDGAATSSTGSGAGTLTANTPNSPGEAIVHRARTTGTYYARVGWANGPPGDYLLSISHGCKINPPTDLAVTQTDTPDPAPLGGNVVYTLSVANRGANPASVVALRDELDPQVAFVAATPSQGQCSGSGPVICDLGTLAAGAAATVTLSITAPASPVTIANRASATTMVIDTDSSNDAAGETTMIAVDSDGDGRPDLADCAPHDAATWAVPTAAQQLAFPHAPADKTLLGWMAPAAPGTTSVTYDALRSASASNFSAPVCVAKNIGTTSATDSSWPISGQGGAAFFYLVRAKDACGGTLGTDSLGAPRSGGVCP